MPDGLPPGVEQQTGMLFASAQPGSVSAGASGTDRVRWAPGSGFAIGLHGYKISSEGWTGADGDGMAWALDTDLGASAVAVNDESVFAHGSQLNQLTTSGMVMFPFVDGDRYPTPMLFVNDVIFVVNASVAAKTVVCKLYYAIYRVSDANFIRIAAFSLARGS